MIRLNSRVHQYGGFTSGRRVFGGAPKLPIGAAGNSFFEDFMHPAAKPTAKPQNLISTLLKIRHASLRADFQSKMGAALIRRVRNAKTEEYFPGKQFSLLRKTKTAKLIRNGSVHELSLGVLGISKH